jgi:hypothetical protein
VNGIAGAPGLLGASAVLLGDADAGYGNVPTPQEGVYRGTADG